METEIRYASLQYRPKTPQDIQSRGGPILFFSSVTTT